MSKTQRIGLIGAGLMGKGIAKTLLEKGFAVTVVAHRNRAPIEELVERGALEVATKDRVLYSAVAGATGVPVMAGEASKTQYRRAQSLGYGGQAVTRIANALAGLAGTSFGED